MLVSTFFFWRIYVQIVSFQIETWTCSPIYSSILPRFDYNLLHNKHLTFVTFVSYRKTQIKDQESKKFCNVLKDWTKKKAYNLFPHQFKYISTYYWKDLVPLLKGCDLYIYYMITLNMYTYCNICPYHLFILFVNAESYSIRSIDSKFHNYV